MLRPCIVRRWSGRSGRIVVRRRWLLSAARGRRSGMSRIVWGVEEMGIHEKLSSGLRIPECVMVWRSWISRSRESTSDLKTSPNLRSTTPSSKPGPSPTVQFHTKTHKVSTQQIPPSSPPDIRYPHPHQLSYQ